MPSFFSNLRSALSAPVGNRQTSMPNDLVQTRRNFSRLGRYEGDTELSVLDRGLDSTIRTFQRDKGLKQDGIMNPGGETERALNRDLENMMRPSEERQPYFASPIRLSAPVGNSKENQSEDVKQVQRSLGKLRLALENKLYEPSGILDRETVDSMRAFQGSNDLRVDGFMNPGGETETAMNSSLYRLSAPLAEESDDEGGAGDNEEETPPPPPPEDGDDGNEGGGNDDGGDNEEDPEEPDCSDKEQALEEAEEELREAEEKLNEAQEELAEVETKIEELKSRMQKKQKCSSLEQAMYEAELERDNKKANVEDFQAEVDRIQAELDDASVVSSGIGAAGSVFKKDGLGFIYNGGKLLAGSMKRERLEQELRAAQAQLNQAQAELDVAQQKMDKAKNAYWACQNGSAE